MTHRPTTIVIPVWNEWEMTRGCLESLRPTLGLHDQVVVVDNGSTDETQPALRRYPWVEVITNEENRGFAAACNQGAIVARGEIVVFLNNDTIVPARWLDSLVAPFDDPTVGATGPRSNFVSGAQALPDGVAYECTRPADVQRFARQWREQHRGQTTEVSRLVGFCLAVSRVAFEDAGGFDESFGLGGCEDDDLCLRIRASNRRLLMVDEGFVHHFGHRTFNGNGVDWFGIQQDNWELLRAKLAAKDTGNDVLLSACMIVRDEQEVLGRCLQSLQQLVDEVVIYDTGSTDRTREIATSAGARVIEGYWDDDFARARNAALQHCRGDWILHVDADEMATGDPATIRGALLHARDVDAFRVRIDNVLSMDEEVPGFSHHAVRLFRRARAHWAGHLHEQVVERRRGELLRRAPLAALHLRHDGYRSDIMAAKEKHERNVRVARAGVAVAGPDRPRDLTNLGRALSASGQWEEALECFQEARSATSLNPALRRTVLREGARTLAMLQRLDEALDWTAELGRSSTRQDMPRYLAGSYLADLQRWEDALAQVQPLREVIDEEGNSVAVGELHKLRVRIYTGLERWSDAAAAARAWLGVAGGRAEVWQAAVEVHARAQGEMPRLAALVADADLLKVLAFSLTWAEGADQLADALWDRHPRDLRLLAAARAFAPDLAIGRALEWAARLREVGLAADCPLLAVAKSESKPPIRRVQAACVAFGTFADPAARRALAPAVAAVPNEELPAALVTVNQFCPALLPQFVTDAATTPARSLALAAELHRHGAVQEALALLDHVSGQPDADSDAALLATTWGVRISAEAGMGALQAR